MLTDKKILESERNSVYVKSTEGSRLTGTVLQNKDVFDKFPQLVMTKFNELIDFMISLNIDALPTDISSRYTKTETEELVEEETSNLVESIDVNTETGVITVTKKDGTVYSVDTALEKVPATFAFIESSGNYYLKVVNVDGTTSQVDVTALMNQYTFTDGAEIDFTVTTSGTTTGVSATINNGSITWAKLDPTIKAYFDDLAEQVESDRALTQSAKQEAVNASQTVTANVLLAQGYKETAEEKATESKSYAVGGTSSRSGEDTDNARYYALQALQAKIDAEEARDEAQGVSGGDFATNAQLNEHKNNTNVHVTATDKNTWNGKANPPVEKTATLTAGGWSGSSAPYTQTVNVEGMTATANGFVGVADSATDAQFQTACEANLRKTAQGSGTMTIKAYGEKPTVNIPITVRLEV